MSAEEDIPNHHVKQEVCVSRPPYREGRRPKAVKVYTVNNESSYLIVQGVPSVGAGDALLKLCSSFGLVEEFKPLDEYPCEDKYTEVYLIKYQRIQSSRFAKRKLDEYSFFGGNLHVCYAPEYEVLQETRDKLRDRRQVVAKKIRQHLNEKTQQQQQRQQQQGNPIEGQTDLALVKTNSSLAVLDHQPPLQQQPLGFFSSPLPTNSSNQPHNSNLSSNNETVFPSNNTPKLPSDINPSTAFPTDVEEGSRVDKDTEYQMFQLPLPPKNSVNPQLSQTNMRQRRYEYSRVPTAHATLPVGYDGRIETPLYKSVSQSPQDTQHELPNKDQHVPSAQNSPIIIKEYKASKPALKFVPRQAVKSAATQDSKTIGAVKQGTFFDDDLRKNSFRLGKPQGPGEMPGTKRVLPTPTERSVDETISSIRSKISKIITEKTAKKP